MQPLDIPVNETQAEQIDSLFPTREEFVEEFHKQLLLVLREGGSTPLVS